MQAGAPGYPPDTYHNGGHPNFPNPGGYGFGAQRMPEEQNIGAGWVGLAAPGTVLAQAQPRHTHAGYNETHERIMRRRTVKKLALENGNLVIETPVAPNICKQNQSKEFTHMRYTAATCDPDQFIAQRYALRPWLLGREIELCIVLTSYNEDEQLLVRTLNSVIKNIAYLTSRTKSKTWGLQGWTKVVVILVADGRKKADKRFLKLLQLMGVYQEGVMVDHVNDKPTVAHIFELTSQVMVSANGSVEVSQCPIQVMLCLKETNAKKLNSHRWFFNAFCAQLKPNVCILLDVGTKPAAKSLYHLWKAFDNHPKCGGACGEITVETGRGCWQLVNPLVAAQNFEYKMSNILDKPLESVFGYITVLPGAFSAYRYKALQGRPLEAYFKGEALHSGAVHGGSFLGNMYLAEDRILCFELVAKRGEGWLLKYVKSARASTDVPDKLPAFIGQRRRWLNGSLFAAIYSTWHFGRMWTSGQGFFRKLLLQFQVIYSLVQLIFAFTGIANFYLAIYFLFSSATSDDKHDPFGGQGDSVLQIVLNALIAIVVVCLILSLGNRPQGSNLAYHAVVILLALLMGVALYTAGFTIFIAADAAGLTHLSGWTGDNILQLIKLDSFRDIVISLASTYVLWVIASIIHFEPWHLVTSFVQYLFLTPCFVIVLAIYSMANTHDLSWGNRPAEPAKDLGKASTTGGKDGKPGQVEVKTTTANDAAELWQSAQREMAVPRVEEKEHRAPTQKAADEAATFRTNLLLIYILVNAVLVLFFTSSYWKRFVGRKLPGSSDPYMAALFWSTAGLSALRATGSVLYIVFRIFGH
ncbi:hypothetical protein IE81DRAFT_290615 [Ceraceosorus guamensis]|uniref:Chitin synthase n=1 Tax=Ceraceosorus guamensis TaxID=1522189 RepID=A0A316W3P7_9BASI|nr:hypothetical protein IE81DRAFT_290615 [Ceraceosorus guamensis]PWN42205.1 hypothetical protein IE81DRAFT_290615 [Ceraceosorus guamensis]